MTQKSPAGTDHGIARDPAAELRSMVNALGDNLRPDSLAARAEIFETHISLVLLSGAFAYKFKKPVDFGFLDFSSLEKRRHFCTREVELNRRTAPDMYVGVVGVARVGGQVTLTDTDTDTGTPIEYAVKMRRFSNDARMDLRIEQQAVRFEDICELADRIAEFHHNAEPAPPSSHFGTAATVSAQIMASFEPLRGLDGADRIEADTAALMQHMKPTIGVRKSSGAIRQCHGDLHLSNVIKLGDTYVPFDCIEFSDDLSWIDTSSDIAFLIMDLDYRGEYALANAFLNRYLDRSGDYGACGVLQLYLLYRTLVRARVAALSLADEGQSAADRRDLHLDLASRYVSSANAPALFITHGLSGSGKSTASMAMANHCGIIHVRSDIERRRLAGLDTTARTSSSLGAGIYNNEQTTQTYSHLLGVARVVLDAGYSVIIDATFLKRAQRQPFRSLAAALGVPFHILDCSAPDAVLRERVLIRERRGRDASEATVDVLERQIQSDEPLDSAEKKHAVAVNAAEVDLLLASDIVGRGGRLAGATEF